MGMYTGLRFRGHVKPEYRQMIYNIMHRDMEWEDFITDFPFISDYAELPRACMIPFGGLAYMPDEWEDANNILTSSFKQQFDMETGYWAFQCSLKNYDSEIDIFIATVIPIICESTDWIEDFYEEWHESSRYKLMDEKIVELEGIKYYEEYSEPEYNWWGVNNG